MASLDDTLDEQQRRAVHAPLGPVAIIAGPGSGKTRTLIARIGHLISSGELAPERILALTHTTKAAGELRDRARRTLGVDITATTVHAAAWKHVTHHQPAPKLLPSTWTTVRHAAHSIGHQLDNTAITEIASEIDWAAARRIPHGNYPTAAADSGRATTVDATVIEQIRRRYQELKTVNGEVDFADILHHAANLHHHTGDHEYDAYFIDEYQDIDPLQQHVIDTWLDGRDTVCVVGDPDQAIFTFKGGDPTLLHTFTDRYPHATVVELTQNYRSTPQIITWINRLALYKTTRSTAGHHHTGPAPRARFTDDETSEEHALVRQLKTWHQQGVPYREMAVLYRYNATAARLEAALGDAAIPHQVAGSQRFFERRDVLDVLIPFGKAARLHPDTPGFPLLHRTATALGFDRDHPPTGWGAARLRHDTIEALLTLVEQHHPDRTAHDVLTDLQQRARHHHDPTIEGVTLSTVHAAKGLEWDAVWVAGVTDGAFPSSYATSISQRREEQHLFYVAVSRARHHLVISAAARRQRHIPNQPSPFFVLLGIATPEPVKRQRSNSKGTNPRTPPGPAPRTLSDMTPPPGRTCTRCGERLRGGAASRSKRCSPTCLDGVERQRFELLVTWRQQHCRHHDLDESAVATDRALFTLAVYGRREPVAGLGVNPDTLPDLEQ